MSVVSIDLHSPEMSAEPPESMSQIWKDRIQSLRQQLIDASDMLDLMTYGKLDDPHGQYEYFSFKMDTKKPNELFTLFQLDKNHATAKLSVFGDDTVIIVRKKGIHA